MTMEHHHLRGDTSSNRDFSIVILFLGLYKLGLVVQGRRWNMCQFTQDHRIISFSGVCKENQQPKPPRQTIGWCTFDWFSGVLQEPDASFWVIYTPEILAYIIMDNKNSTWKIVPFPKPIISSLQHLQPVNRNRPSSSTRNLRWMWTPNRWGFQENRRLTWDDKTHLETITHAWKVLGKLNIPNISPPKFWKG